MSISKRLLGIINIFVNCILWLIAITVYYQNNIVASIIFIAMSVLAIIMTSYIRESIINVDGLFTFFLYFTIGLACLKLVGVESVTWSLKTWICLFLSWLSFTIAANVGNVQKRGLSKKIHRVSLVFNGKYMSDPLYHICILLTLLSLFSFAYCVQYYGYIPLFSTNVYAYTEFGSDVTIYLFCQISVIIPGMAIPMLKQFSGYRKRIIQLLIVANFLVCLLVKSRDFLTGCTIIILTSFYYTFIYGKKFSVKYKILIILVLVLAVMLFFRVTAARNYSDAYLTQLFRANGFKWATNLLSPYVYITAGYYNLNKLINGLSMHTYGLMGLSAFWILFRVYPIRNYLSSVPIYYIIPELNLSTSFATYYYDFGIVGIVLYGFLTGWIFSFAEVNYLEYKDCFSLILFGIAIHHAIMAFYTCWITSFQYLVYVILLIIGIWLLPKSE